MMCKVRNPSRRVGWRSRERGAGGRRAAVRGFNDALDQVVSKDAKWFIGCLVCAAWWALALVFCRSAYAAPSVEIDGNFAGYDNGQTYNGYVVVDTPSEYIATLLLIDEYSTLVQIDSEVYAKLMSESHGGRFWELLQLWDKVGRNASGTEENLPDWAGSQYFLLGLQNVYGYGRVWECVTTDALIEGAKEDFNTILDGGSIGGGGGNGDGLNGETDGTFYYYDFTEINENYSGWYSENNVDGVVFSQTWIDRYHDVVSQINDLGKTPKFCILAGGVAGETGTGCLTMFVWGIEDEDPLYETDASYNVYCTAQNMTCSFADATNRFTIKRYNNRNYVYIDLETLGNIQSLNYNHQWLLQRPWYAVYNIQFGEGLGGGGSGGGNNDPVPTPPDDPTDPVAPTPNPPTPNPPTTPTVPGDDPLPPVNPTGPTIEVPPTGTTPSDYTPWLEKILQQLINLTSYLETCFTWLNGALETHCQHIRDHMTTCTQSLIDYMGALMSNHELFLSDLAQWIVDNLRWENSGGEFDDSNMIYWLRRIYARQGAGDVNTRPVDPATDYSGFSGWLGVLYDAVALDVSDTSLTALTSSLSGLQHTFPFSLPWDVKQVLQALDVSPVTPSASIPSGTSGVSYNVDLHWMDSAMVSVRAFELLVFIVYVMVHTKDLFGYLMGE